MPQPYLLETADIRWEGTTPYSLTYKDIYWLHGEAIAEKQYVFIDAVKRQLDAAQPPTGRWQFSIGELGFGFGTNCLLTADYWASSHPRDTMLNYVSIEKHPVDKQTLQTHLDRFHFRHARTLLDQYPPACVGQHVIWLAPNIRLLLIFDDANTALSELDASVDAWFLDGFSPARNEDMWDENICRKLFSRSKPGAIVTTYAAAGKVRRALQDNGFEIHKRPGFGAKKEMLFGTRRGDWRRSRFGTDAFTIVGGGLAGLFCAEALARRGIDFTLIDANAARPSDIPQLTVLPQLAVAAEARHRYSLLAAQYMTSAPGFHQSGLIWHGRSDDEIRRLHATAGQFPDEFMFVETDGSVVFPKAGWFAFADLKAMIDVEPVNNTVDSLIREQDCWTCMSGGEAIVSAEQVILATGSNTTLFGDNLPVDAIRGQAISVRTNNIARVINGDVAVFPTVDGCSVVSGTYARSAETGADETDSKLLRQMAGRYVANAGEVTETFVGIRAVSRDRLPVVDRAPNWDALANTTINRVSGFRDYQQGLSLCLAFGSRGATHARLSAEHLVSKLLGEPSALSVTHQRMLAATRFAIRDAHQKPGR